jgi:hypothetical protein
LERLPQLRQLDESVISGDVGSDEDDDAVAEETAASTSGEDELALILQRISICHPSSRLISTLPGVVKFPCMVAYMKHQPDLCMYKLIAGFAATMNC